ncbi:MAG: NUDIX domain-containing protein [Terricaulis sp.]
MVLIWLVRRPDKGLLGGMAGLPTTPWREEAWSAEEARTHAPANADWRPLGAVRHVFTHFALTLDVWSARAEPADAGGWWANAGALPTVFRKAAELREPPRDPC